jgi:DNA polymerase elongation subunit (family B)
MIAKCLCSPPTLRTRPQNSIGMMDVGCVDLMQFVREMFGQSMEGVRLENFCRHFGVPGKAGIKYSEITRAFIEKDADVTEQVALYCAEDCDALCRAATASGAETTIAEFARLVGMNSDAMWTSGQSARFVYLVARQSHALGFVMDWINETMRRFGALFGLYDAAPHAAAAPAKRPAPDERSAPHAAAAATTTTKGYKGATVLEPKTGFRGTYPMCTGDFQSLYPSIMRGMGICFSTLVLGGTEEARSLACAGVRLMRIQVSSEGEPEKHQWFVQPQVLVDQHIDGSRALFDQRWCGLRLPPGQSRRPHDAKLDGAAVQPSVWAQSSETWSDEPVPASGGGGAAAATGVVAFPRSPRLTQMYAQQQAAVLPALEEMLFNMRADVKKQMGKEPKGSIGYAVLNTRQDAIKRMMNSIYGGTGLINGPYMCVPVAESITSTGRSLIIFSKNFVETYPFQKLITFRRAGSADTDWITQEYDPAVHDDASAFADRAHPPLQKPCEVIYGDTDSIMFVIYIPDRFLHDDMVKGCFAKSVADFLLERLNECFPKPITIVNEQIAFRFFLKGKKMYANMYKENPKSKNMSQKVKGLAMVRRDWPEIAKRTQERCVDRILNHKEGVAAALRTATRAIFAVLDRSLPIEDYVITQELKKISASPQEHVTAAYAMNRIDRSKNFGKGDRVPYVITTRSDPARLNVPKDFLSSTAPIHDDDDDAAAAAATTKDASKDQAKKLCTRSRCIGDPDASLENIDSHYYIEILRSPLEMFFKEDPRSMATLQHAFSFALARSKDGAGAGASSAPSMSILDIMRRRKAQLEAAAATATATAGGTQ